MRVLDFINTLRKSDRYIPMIFLNGGCYQFYKVLKTLFPEAKPYIDKHKGHIVTLIDGNFYDITGIVKGVFYELTEEDEVMCINWSFSKQHFLYRECPNCEEPIPIEL